MQRIYPDEHPTDPITPSYDVVISGMGMAGLTTALEAAKLNKSVLIISNRSDDFVRMQRVGLLKQTKNYTDIRKYLRDLLPKEKVMLDDLAKKMADMEAKHVEIFFKLLCQANDLEQKILSKGKQRKNILSIENKILILDRLLREIKKIKIQDIFLLSKEEREETIKLLRIKYPQITKRDFKSIIEDLRFLYLLNVDLGIQIKDIERYLKRRLDERRETKQIDYVFNAKLTNIDLAAGTINIGVFDKESQEQTQQLETHFKYLVGADGTHHHALNLINEDSKKSGFKEVQFTPDNMVFNNQHLSAYILIQSIDGAKLKLPKIDTQNSKYFFSEPKEFITMCSENLGFSLLLDKNSYIKSGKKKVKANFTCEVPEEIYTQVDSPNDPLVKEFITQAVTRLFQAHGMDNGELTIEIVKQSRKHPHKDKLKLRFFPTSTGVASQAVIQRNEHTFILVGDAFRAPYYVAGHGTQDAFEHAILAGKLISEDLSAEEYNERCMELSNKTAKVIQGIHVLRKVNPSELADQINQNATHEQKLIRR